VTTYANGTEATTREGEDAARVALLKNPSFPVTMQVEGQTVSMLEIGTVPTLAEGITQINRAAASFTAGDRRNKRVHPNRDGRHSHIFSARPLFPFHAVICYYLGTQRLRSPGDRMSDTSRSDFFRNERSGSEENRPGRSLTGFLPAHSLGQAGTSSGAACFSNFSLPPSPSRSTITVSPDRNSPASNRSDNGS
jgi:hypothetical protein